MTDQSARIKTGRADREKALDELDDGRTDVAIVHALLDVAAAIRSLPRIPEPRK